jgi:hypothetical protein
VRIVTTRLERPASPREDHETTTEPPEPEEPTASAPPSREALRAARRRALPRPEGAWWWPWTWIRLLSWHWRLGGPVTEKERRGYQFWGPTVLLVLGVELLGSLSESFKNWIPWPTISATVGHLEKRWDWVAVIVVGLLTAVAFQALASRKRERPDGRTVRESGPPVEEESWYSPVLVGLLTVVAFAVPYAFHVSKYRLGYTIYGTLGVFGILIPSILSVGFNRLVRFPTLFFTIDQLRHRLHAVALVLVAGLAILTVHLAFYPWPDITHESASFAGLNPERARAKAVRQLRAIRKSLPPLAYSTQARGVVDGTDTWFVYFSSGCVVQVTSKTAAASPECSR